MSGILYVVATPIGNLEDITLRALRILREVSLIAAEDTRRTARLLQHYSISTPTTSLHEHNERGRTAALVARLQQGESIALVSDAGTPVISDPGQFLVASVRSAGLRVEGIPGPSAVMTALSISGFAANEFLFLGFPPSRANDRRRWFARLTNEERLVVFFEAPHRIRSTIETLGRLLGPERPIGIARELTKIHEEMVVRPISDVLQNLAEPRGEYTVILAPSKSVIQPTMTLSADAVDAEFGEMTKHGSFKPREAMKALAERYRVPVNEIYRIVVEGKRSGK